MMNSYGNTKKRHKKKGTDSQKKAKLSIQPCRTPLQSALAFHQQGRFNEAETLYREILQSYPQHFDALQLLATLNAQQNRYDESLKLFDQALAINPDHPSTLNNFGNALSELKRHEEALVNYEKAIALQPDYAEAYANHGKALQELKRYEEALKSFNQALKLNTNYAEAYTNRGITFHRLKRYEEALVNYQQAIALNPASAEVYSAQGITLYDLQRYHEALDSYDRAIVLNPDCAQTYSNRGLALQELKRQQEALVSYDKAIMRSPGYAQAYSNQGNTLFDLNRYNEALASYEKAIELKLDYTDAFYNHGTILSELKRYEEALSCYEKALTLQPDYEYLCGTYINTRMRMCHWNDIAQHISRCLEKIALQEKASLPFPLLALVDSPTLHKKTADIYIHGKYSRVPALPAIQKYQQHSKIRIGYYSADFHDHATAYLMAELFERHDRTQFELFAFSFGPDKQDTMRNRVAAAFDQFLDVRSMTDKEVAQLSRTLEIDIAVDLKGFTKDSRHAIFAYRAAPLQVNYLGYPGTLGTEYIDYLIADETLIPENSKQYYSEKIVYLPNSYQVNDSKRIIDDKVFSREELGLPPSGFVFCCFNNNYKITPATFDSWIRILHQVKNSVLWLFEDSQQAANNLRTEALNRGIDSERVIFATRLPLPEHLARHRAADLFLDTLPYNAHTTASDALWAGLPVLTCMGESFAGRVAASLLHAIRLPELVTTTSEAYESLAIDLALHPEKLSNIKQKLANNRLSTPLFDARLFTSHIEQAYTLMYQRYHQNLAPAHINTPATADY